MPYRWRMILYFRRCPRQHSEVLKSWWIEAVGAWEKLVSLCHFYWLHLVWINAQLLWVNGVIGCAVGGDWAKGGEGDDVAINFPLTGLLPEATEDVFVRAGQLRWLRSLASQHSEMSRWSNTTFLVMEIPVIIEGEQKQDNNGWGCSDFRVIKARER